MDRAVLDLLSTTSAVLASAARTLELARAECEEAIADRSPTPPPITSWRGVADAVGVSEDTVLRRRRRHDVELTEPWFQSVEECRDWYRSLGRAAPREHERPTSHPRRAVGTTLADLKRQIKR